MPVRRVPADVVGEGRGPRVACQDPDLRVDRRGGPDEGLPVAMAVVANRKDARTGRSSRRPERRVHPERVDVDTPGEPRSRARAARAPRPGRRARRASPGGAAGSSHGAPAPTVPVEQAGDDPDERRAEAVRRRQAASATAVPVVVPTTTSASRRAREQARVPRSTAADRCGGKPLETGLAVDEPTGDPALRGVRGRPRSAWTSWPARSSSIAPNRNSVGPCPARAASSRASRPGKWTKAILTGAGGYRRRALWPRLPS